jgi:putative transposase
METGGRGPGDDGHVTDERHHRDDDRAVLIALFRYGIIAPLADREANAPGEVVSRVREIAGREHHLPGRGPVRISERTVYAWLAAYRKGGLDALRPVRRKDRGQSRVLADEVLERAVHLRKEVPARRTKTLLHILVLEKTVPQDLPFHRATLDRHLRRRGVSRRQLRTLSTRRHIKMAFEHFGDLWVGDYHHGPPVLTPDGRVTTAKIAGFLDHCTRYPVVSRYYLSEEFETLRDAMLRAFLAFGLPKVVYVDRGSVFRAEQLAYSLLRLDSHLVHSKAYYSEGRGLIERWWQLLDEFEEEVRALDRLLSIHELNAYWEPFRESRYCQVVHSEIDRTPAQAITGVEPRPLDPAVARELFLVGEDRVVHKKTSCVSVLATEFLCESFLKGRKVRVRFDPRDLSSVLVFLDGEKAQTAFPRPVNARPEPEPTPEVVARSVDYLELLRRDYDKKLLEHARPLAYAKLDLDPGFDVERYLDVVKGLAGLALRAAEKRALVAFWDTFGPLPEYLVRIGVEHAVRMQGRGRHVDAYLHAVKTLVLAHWRGGKENR